MKKETKITIAVFLAVAFLLGSSFGYKIKELSLEAKNGCITCTTPICPLDLGIYDDQEIQDEFEERFGSVLKKEDWKDIEELTEIPFELWETMTRRGIFWQTWNMGHNVGFKEGSELVEEPQVCIHERYKQIKDTMKSKAGTEFEWHEYYCSEPFRKYLQDTEPNGELFISEDTGRLCFPQGAVYTKEEILTNFFEPI